MRSVMLQINECNDDDGFVWFPFAKIKDAKIILHVKSPTFKAAKLKVFTVRCYL